MSTIQFTNLLKYIIGGDSLPQPSGGTTPGRVVTTDTVADAQHIRTSQKPEIEAGAGIPSTATGEVSPLFAEYDFGNPFNQE